MEVVSSPPNSDLITLAPYEKILADHKNSLEARIRKALTQGVHDESWPRLIAVSKNHPVEAIIAAHKVGLRFFGENYAQELKSKVTELRKIAPLIADEIQFVYLGRIQSNKIPLMLTHAAEIMSVGSVEHGLTIDKNVHKLGLKSPYPIWLLVNAGEEASKSGFHLEDLQSSALILTQNCPHLVIEGIMAIPPPLETLTPSPAQGDTLGSGDQPLFIPDLYHKLRLAALELPPHPMRSGPGKLSLGMSSDLEVALAVGSHCLRIGTALFGPRLPKVSR